MESTIETKPAPAIPDWLAETPNEHSYELVMFESGDAEAQSVQLTRGEYILLKKHVAGLRGLPVPPDEDEPETAPAEAKQQQAEAESTNGAAAAKTDWALTMPKSTLGRIRADLAEEIADIVKHNAVFVAGVDQATIMGDLQVLKEIVLHWENGGSNDYPNETPLIGSIREDLHL